MASNTTPAPTSAPTLQDLDALANWLTNTPVRVDCFFVTLAVMLGTTTQNLAHQLGMEVPKPGTQGVSIPQIIHGLTALGLAFRVWTYNEPPSGGGPIRNQPHRSVQGVSEPLAHAASSMPPIVGAAYLRRDGSGHVVVCRSPGTPYRRYIDYQASRDGKNVTNDAHGSRICVIFGVDLKNSTGTFFKQQKPKIEKMEVDEEKEHHEPMETDHHDDKKDKSGNDTGYWGGRFHDEL
ncbi:hypothetical protein BD413DRAFT_615104 [Trametes elegans]|nr:hypothetical protein BD413DRAFT_615104 [Trametes elegans]